MIGVDEALQRLLDATPVLGTETVPLSEALGRTLAEPVEADRDFPPTDRSAMDGYAVRAEDLAAPGRTLRVVGEIPAGHSAQAHELRPAETLRIFTGGVVPRGADAVVMVEETTEDPSAGTVRFEKAARPLQHIRTRGQDQRAGQRILEPGVRIRPAEITALASVGRVQVRVHRLPAVRVLSTGDEIVEPDRRPAEHQVRNSNAAMLTALLREAGFQATYLGIASDRPAALRERVDAGLDGDLLLITGGVSVGRYDLVGETLEAAGVRQLFHKVAMKPGKPILAACRDATMVLGLPGNPVSTCAGFAVFGLPLLRKMTGLAEPENRLVTVRLRQMLRRRPGRLTYHLARVGDDEGVLRAEPVATTGSGDVLSLAGANAFVISPAEATDLPEGTELPALVWRGFPQE